MAATTPSVSYVLYVVQQSKGCETAQTLLKQYAALRKEVHVQDIRLIERPDWLRGVPVLAKISTREIWEGTAALEQMHYLGGYYAALEAATPAQPWAAHDTSLTLPPPAQPPHANPLSHTTPLPPPPSVPQPAPAAPPPPPAVPHANPLSQPVLAAPPPAPAPLVPPPRPTPPSSLLTSAPKADPNQLQPLPLPDNERPQQELKLPSPPRIRKREISAADNNNPAEALLSQLPEAGLRSLRPALPPAEDHVAMVFTPAELDLVTRVMQKPKTVNRRGQSSETEDPSTRVFPTSVERTRHVVVQKEDNSTA